MRSDQILKDKAARWNADPEIWEFLAARKVPENSALVYSAPHAASLKRARFNRDELSATGAGYERIDQLTFDLLMGVMLSAAGSLRWWRDALSLSPGQQPTFDQLSTLASEAAPGCEGLIFLPYLTGERTPHNDPEARGAFVGLTVRHTAAHLTRAVLEGVAYGLRDSLELMRALGLSVKAVRATGGGVKSALWRQILADVFQASLITVNSTEGAAYGAAILAAVGAGHWRDVPEACAAIVRETGVTAAGKPAPEYAAGYARYRALYPALAALNT